MSITAQFSIYPLRALELGSVIDAALIAARECGVVAEPGLMSTVLEGTEDAVFAALRAAFHSASERGDTVLVVTVSNACKPD